MTVQNESLPSNIENLRAGRELNRNSKLFNLNPFLDKLGVLRVGGRLQKGALPPEIKHPSILPPNHMFSEMLVRQAHEQVLHSGVRDTLTQVRKTTWILRGRQLSKKVVLKCLMCCKFKLKASWQSEAPLPREPITEVQPFEVMGVDFAGPLYVTPNYKKVYISLFTCAVTRAVHLELVSDMTTEAFLMPFKTLSKSLFAITA